MTHKIVFVYLLLCAYLFSEEPPWYHTLSAWHTLDTPYEIEADISNFDIGTDISSWNIPVQSGLIAVDSAQMYPFFVVNHDNILYDIAYSRDDNIVRYISIRNTYPYQRHFKTPEGVFLNMSYKEFHKKYWWKKLKYYNGWGYCTQLKSGWVLLFSTTGREFYPRNNDKICLIFKDGRDGYF
ncbi:MAG: hypothetical protein Ta2G_18340 [Termitinemataceae bacterium]|nr:MAG: hypothetical protein Ta2G_18340 [Termitinemataceae bacterium]